MPEAGKRVNKHFCRAGFLLSLSVVICHRSLDLAARDCLSQTGVSCWLQQALGPSSLSRVYSCLLCAVGIWRCYPPALLRAPLSFPPALGNVWTSESSSLLLSSLHVSSRTLRLWVFFFCPRFISKSAGKELNKLGSTHARVVCDRGITKSPGSSNSAADRGFGGCGAADGSALLQPQD